jgi:hypothetical protein
VKALIAEVLAIDPQLAAAVGDPIPDNFVAALRALPTEGDTADLHAAIRGVIGDLYKLEDGSPRQTISPVANRLGLVLRAAAAAMRDA